MEIRNLRLGVGVAVALLFVALALTVPSVMVGIDAAGRARVTGWPLLAVVVELLGLVAGIVYLATSFAVEHQRVGAEGRDDAASRRAAERMAGRGVPDTAAISAVRDGAATARQLAEVLGVYEHVAERMIDVLVARGQVELGEGGRLRIVTRERATTAAGRAPHWIDPDA